MHGQHRVPVLSAPDDIMDSQIDHVPACLVVRNGRRMLHNQVFIDRSRSPLTRGLTVWRCSPETLGSVRPARSAVRRGHRCPLERWSTALMRPFVHSLTWLRNHIRLEKSELSQGYPGAGVVSRGTALLAKHFPGPIFRFPASIRNGVSSSGLEGCRAWAGSGRGNHVRW